MESGSLHSSLLILMIVLLSAAVTDTADGSLGPWSTIITIVGVFFATLIFFAYSMYIILRNSHSQPGLLGKLAKMTTRALPESRRNERPEPECIKIRSRRTKKLTRANTIDLVA